MTTIACDGKHIAGDGLVTSNGMFHCQDFRKVYRLANGSVVGFTGSIYNINPALDFLNGSRDFIDLGEHFEALILHADGTCLTMDGKGCQAEISTPAVAGNGGPFAMAAMMLGKSAVEAVELAAKLDNSTGGQIVSMTPEQPQ